MSLAAITFIISGPKQEQSDGARLQISPRWRKNISIDKRFRCG